MFSNLRKVLSIRRNIWAGNVGKGAGRIVGNQQGTWLKRTDVVRRTLTTDRGAKSAQDLLGKAAENAMKDPTRQHAREVREAFNRWRREHTVFLVSSGVIIGAGCFGVALYLYLDRYPSAIEFFVVERAIRAFDSALSFESKKKVYMGLPEPNVPNFELLFMKALEDFLESTESENEKSRSKSKLNDAQFSAENLLFGWADHVESALSKTEGTWILASKMLMRKKLEEEINAFPTLDDRLDALWEIYPPSVERNLAISTQIDRHMKEGKFIPGVKIEKLRPQTPEYSCDALTSVLIYAIAFFPGPINKLIHFLESPAPDSEEDVWKVVAEIVNDLNDAVAEQDAKSSAYQSIRRRSSRRILESTGLIRSALEKTLAKMKVLYDGLPDPVKSYVLTTALRTTITNLPNLPRVGNVRPYDLYVRAIENDLIGPLRRDARISEDILREVKSIFLAMPGDLQTRVLLTAVRHPLASAPLDECSPEAQAELVRDLLSSGGVVAVKLAQMLAEHPRVPRDYQIMLGSLRDENEPMAATQFWWQIPSAVRTSITDLGSCLGTGSVKQANMGRFDDGKEQAVVVLRSQVEDEALSSISALETSDELGPVATRLGRLVYGEFNLFGEGEVLVEFANTEIGQHPLFHVVRVRHHSPKCLVEEIAKGTSVATALEKPIVTEEDQNENDRVKAILVEYHKTVMSAFIADGVIHSDVHLGNANYVRASELATLKGVSDLSAEDIAKTPQKQTVLSTIEENGGGFVLFDVGQFDRIGLPDTKALLWTLASLSSAQHRVTLKNVAIAHLASTASLKDKSIKDEREQKKILKERLSIAYGEAIQPNADGEIPDKRTAYMLFLRAAEAHGVDMPNGAFSVAKMIDGIVSQQERYNLPQVVDENIETFLRSHMTWGELADIGARQLKIM